ncbi:hypothetical protein HOU08_gp032 [Dickeya phage vB_DsoM_JA29]|uniref:Uncharacterized protein n=1 Tax=Dickeya phage vB_DsoM_JA29 TaxID=2283031 RepID=A0A384ZWX8_9CAUD|nr:hypothetical protein HOU08_gp032 [Dickeya phage vB_DsoM_JA29]AXG66758.1 hypothetical protein JA29_032 [Dickeya phage vB_DsoM_JA29]
MKTLTPVISCHWFHNGDFPGENPDYEGTVVRYFRHPDHSGDSICPHCNNKFHDHGFVDRSDSMIVCPGDVLFSFYANDVIENLGKISAKSYKEIFGAEALLKAQQNNRSFSSGDTREEIFRRKFSQEFAPKIRSYLNAKLAAHCEQSVELNFAPPYPPKNLNTLDWHVNRLNETVVEYWTRIATDYPESKKRLPSVVNVWDSPLFKEVQEQLKPFDLKLFAEEEFNERFPNWQN